ncbi:MAG TPA: multicopper oxidase domain-containing protein [Chitinophagaceae bacterium]|nr:multicopper oxidase domain-containing protein [Chitinophagaceae bacterium]
MWIYHCYILEHHGEGMMANFEVIDGNKDAEQRMQHSHHVHSH